MQNIFFDVNYLDKRCYDKFSLTEDLLMENAAIGIKQFIENNFKQKSKILIVSGMGNNGADGIALARMLHLDYEIELFIPFGVKSQMALLQLKRAKLLNVNIVNVLNTTNYDVIVDALFGTGLNSTLNPKTLKLIENLNKLNSYKIACDIPSGIDKNGKILGIAFIANTTITMGALKLSLFSDEAKDYVGEIIVANLGIARENYEDNTNYFLLEKEDLKLPLRTKKNSHKGDFGHTNIICGEKEGAAILASLSAFKFGCGLVTLISQEKLLIPIFIMQNQKISKNVTSICLGMGLGKLSDELLDEILSKDVPIVIDADMFYNKNISKFLEKNVILTPHPKEFTSLLKTLNIADVDVKNLQEDRFKYVLMFSSNYPDVILLLKGANTIIAYREKLYINPFGSNNLSKGGSGDVLAGMIASLLAQNYSPIKATIWALLAHSLAAMNYKNNNYSMTPIDLIENICTIV